MTVIQARKGKLLGAGVKACARFGGQTRYLWNEFTRMNNDRMKAEGKFVFYNELSAMLPKLLKTDEKLGAGPFPMRTGHLPEAKGATPKLTLSARISLPPQLTMTTARTSHAL
jgi:hypothetical protein